MVFFEEIEQLGPQGSIVNPTPVVQLYLCYNLVSIMITQNCDQFLFAILNHLLLSFLTQIVTIIYFNFFITTFYLKV